MFDGTSAVLQFVIFEAVSEVHVDRRKLLIAWMFSPDELPLCAPS